MSYEVRVVTDEDELVELHKMAVSTFDPSVQCTPGEMYPPLEQLRRAPHVYGAYLDGRPVAVVLVSERGQGCWLNGETDHVIDAAVSLLLACHRDLGAAWGMVPNDGLRARIAAASGGRVTDEGPGTCWIGVR